MSIAKATPVRTDTLDTTLSGCVLAQARCVACEPGTYCPEGTYVVAENDPTAMAALDCPEGSYCASPSERSPCAAGTFCPARSTAPTTCEYADLLLKPAVSRSFTRDGGEEGEWQWSYRLVVGSRARCINLPQCILMYLCGVHLLLI